MHDASKLFEHSIGEAAASAHCIFLPGQLGSSSGVGGDGEGGGNGDSGGASGGSGAGGGGEGSDGGGGRHSPQLTKSS